MSDTSPLNPPDAPPAGPVIPEGLATKLGKLLIAAFAVTALVTAVLDGDHTPETLMALGGSIATAITLILGRSAQAYAIYRDAPAVGAQSAPSEEELVEDFPEDPPEQEPQEPTSSAMGTDPDRPPLR